MTTRSLVPAVPTLMVFATVLAWASPHYSDWSPPEKLAAVNSALLEFPNAISKDGLSLYIQRGTGQGVGEDLWVSRRGSRESAWGAPERLPEPINSAGFNERAAALSPDGHWLFFASNRTGGQGGLDVWASRRQHVHDDFGWEPPVNIGTAVNTSAAETGPTFYDDDDTGQTYMYFVSNRSGGPGAEDIYVSAWNEDGSFSAPTLVPELSSPGSDQRPYVRKDGREIYLHSNRTGSLGGFDLWVSTRADTRDVWSTPVNPASLNTTSQDVAAVLSRDGYTLFFGGNRPGADAGDIFVTVRRKARSDSMSATGW